MKKCLKGGYSLIWSVALLSAVPGLAKADFMGELVAKFPSVKGAKVETAWPGFHSVVRGQEVLFVKDDLSILVNGDVVDLNAGISLTKQLREANKPFVDVTKFDVNDAIHLGTGSSKVFVFSDPDCPFCKQLQHELEGLKNTQVLIFPFPLVSLHPGAAAVAESIWCNQDRTKSWNDYVLKGIQPPSAQCSNPIGRNLALGEQLQIQGTPAIFFEDGSMVPGAIPLARIEAMVAQANARTQAKAAQ